MKRNPMMLKKKPLNGTHLTVVGNSIFLLALQEGIKSFFSNNEKKSYDAKE